MPHRFNIYLTNNQYNVLKKASKLSGLKMSTIFKIGFTNWIEKHYPELLKDPTYAEWIIK